MWDEYWEDRGYPWEYDPGPPRNRSWPRLFAETPNYRGIGVARTGREEFRWHHGPMFYRGRTTDDDVKVIVIGQEGAQDESLAHRSFVGGTGARMQYLLRHLGITESYLFLNTFVYPIFGQYDDDLRPLAQHPDSPIVRHRHEILDYVLARNDPRLVIAVGTAAKETVASWIAAQGGTADPHRLHDADASVLAPRLRAVGVLHPGGAAAGGATQIIADFKATVGRIEQWAHADATWLPPDPGGVRLPAADYVYRSAPIPFRDLPFGVAWRLGRGGTSSNRKDDQRSIQLFSASGKYNNRGHDVSYDDDAFGTPEGYHQDSGDVAYEPPKVAYREFDRGPSPSLARLLMGGDPTFPWPDFSALGLGCHPSFGFGAVYRGRLDRPAILVVADQQSRDDLFTCRALTGDGGQHLQAFLRAAGLTEHYAILRVLPVDTLDEGFWPVQHVVDDPLVRALYAEAVRRIEPHVVLAAGSHARRLVDDLGVTVPVVEMKAYDQSGRNADWRRALGELAALSYPRDLAAPTFAYDGAREQIPRADLPFGTLRWQGSSGDRAVPALRDGTPSADYVKLAMPQWAYDLAPEALSPADAVTVSGLS